jgi:CRISPR type III-B/RAMP module-associated protein Cmr5
MAEKNRALDLAISCMDALKKTFDGEVLKGFRSRARDVALDIYYGGLTYAIAFIAAKASKEGIAGSELMEQALKATDIANLFKEWKEGKCVQIQGGDQAQSKEKGNIECIDKEAYELYGACLMRALRELANLNPDNLLALLKDLNDPAKQVLVTNKILEFAEWLKRIAEAAIARQSGRNV